ncbi:MAG: polyphosphate kinase 1 [Flavobacteriales bacterium]|nr:polyphosphate kinase 1 [Flavobacteriales bacterium]
MSIKRKGPDWFINRELSWLAFNHRVLQEASHPATPLIERLRFLGIFSNNLDEFFRVRVANLQRAAMVGNKTTTTLGFDVKETLVRVSQKVVELQEEYNRVFNQAIFDLEKENIHIVDESQFTPLQKEFSSNYFKRKIRTHLVPIMMGPKVSFPDLRDGSLYLAVGLKVRTKARSSVRYAIIEIPRHLPRFVVIPSDESGQFVTFIDDIIRQELYRIFSLFQPEHIFAHAIKVSRDAEIDMDDDLSHSLMEKMSRGVRRRREGDFVRFLYDRTMPLEMLKMIKKNLSLAESENVISGSRYHNKKDLMGFPTLGRVDLTYQRKEPLSHPMLNRKSSLLDQIVKRDVLLQYPYHQFGHVVDIMRESAIDPSVESIKINLYRVAYNSQIINALVNASRNGKSVHVVIELAARFDEQHNIKVSSLLQEAGAVVEFGVPGLKVHSKLFLITRIRNRKKEMVAHIGTGNFHEETATVFCDFAILTSNPGITSEVEKLFRFFSHNYERPMFRHLVVSPYSTRRKFSQLIQREVDFAKEGKPARMILKLNNLVDADMIEKLYVASQAGVRIDLIIRGICSLIPGVKGMSENIRVRSVIGRYLEHARVLVFGNDGSPDYYLSSADWMTRNLDRRVEVSVPVLDPLLQSDIATYLDLQLRDNVKARRLDARMQNIFEGGKHGKGTIDSQAKMYEEYLKRLD